MTVGPGDGVPEDDETSESADGTDDPAADPTAARAEEATHGFGGSPHVHVLDPDESPSTGVVVAVADATGRRASSLDPLAEVVDPDALDRLLDHAGSGTVGVSFTYAGTTVTVESTGTVFVYR